MFLMDFLIGGHAPLFYPIGSSTAQATHERSGGIASPTLSTSTNPFFTLKNDLLYNDRQYSDGPVSPGAAMSNGQFISMLPGQSKSTSANPFFTLDPLMSLVYNA